MNMAHYLDALRQAECDALAQQGTGVIAFNRQLAGQPLTPEEQAAAAQFTTDHPQETATLTMAANAATASIARRHRTRALPVSRQHRRLPYERSMDHSA